MSESHKSIRFGCQNPKEHISSDYSYTDGIDCGELGSNYGLKPFPFQQNLLND